MDQEFKDSLHKHFGKNKILPEDFELPALLAISHFPTLKDVRIEFQVIQQGPPLSSRPTTWTTLFRNRKKRKYIITINDNMNTWYSSLLLRNLTFNAQIGVLGHELAHTADFVSKGRLGMLRVAIGNLSWKYVDKLEFNTDKMVINHGLGHQLLEWSVITHRTLEEIGIADELEFKRNGRERYMKPSTIRNYMNENPIYGSKGFTTWSE